jgi:hypothetical protein
MLLFFILIILFILFGILSGNSSNLSFVIQAKALSLANSTSEIFSLPITVFSFSHSLSILSIKFKIDFYFVGKCDVIKYKAFHSTIRAF